MHPSFCVRTHFSLWKRKKIRSTNLRSNRSNNEKSCSVFQIPSYFSKHRRTFNVFIIFFIYFLIIDDIYKKIVILKLLSIYLFFFIYLFIIYGRFTCRIVTTNLHRLTWNVLNKRKGLKKLIKTMKNQVIIQNCLN